MTSVGSDGEQEGPAAILARLAEIVAPFGLERRMEDEPAHHARALEDLAEGGAAGEHR